MAPTEEQIRSLVERFYGRVQQDAELGPIFAARLDGRWPAHLDKMVDFWSSALRRTGRYAGNPRAAHAAIEGLERGHFARWLSLFDATLQELFEPALAADWSRRAHAMATGLMTALPGGRRNLPLTEAPMTKPLHIEPETFARLPLRPQANALLEELRESQSDHKATTLVKSPGLTLVLVALRAGAKLAEHSAPGPVAVLPLLGTLRVEHGERPEAVTGPVHEAVLMGPGLRHSVHADTDAVLLLTIGVQ